MTNAQLANALPTFTFDTLGRAYGIFAAKASAAPARATATMWMNRRAAVAIEAARRGAVIRKLHDGSYDCGYPSDFEPITR